MPKFRFLDGINIQWPWSKLLVDGKKSIETRSYPLPESLRGIELAIIETPGTRGKKVGIKKARIIGTIVFNNSYQYKSKKHWLSDQCFHLVSTNDKFKYVNGKSKYAWTVGQVHKLAKPVNPPTKRGIILAKKCKLPVV